MPACGRASVLLTLTVIAGRWLARPSGSGRPVSGGVAGVPFLPAPPPTSAIPTIAMTPAGAPPAAIHRLRRTRALTALMRLRPPALQRPCDARARDRAVGSAPGYS